MTCTKLWQNMWTYQSPTIPVHISPELQLVSNGLYHVDSPLPANIGCANMWCHLICETNDQLFAEHFPFLCGKLIPEVCLSILDTSHIHYSIGYCNGVWDLHSQISWTLYIICTALKDNTLCFGERFFQNKCHYMMVIYTVIKPTLT